MGAIRIEKSETWIKQKRRKKQNIMESILSIFMMERFSKLDLFSFQKEVVQ